MYVCIVCLFVHHLLIAQSNMEQPCKVAKPARDQLNRVIKCPCRSICGMYILCTDVCICLHRFLHVYMMYIRARFTAVYAYMCDHSGTGIHYVL